MITKSTLLIVAKRATFSLIVKDQNDILKRLILTEDEELVVFPSLEKDGHLNLIIEKEDSKKRYYVLVSEINQAIQKENLVEAEVQKTAFPTEGLPCHAWKHLGRS